MVRSFYIYGTIALATLITLLCISYLWYLPVIKSVELTTCQLQSCEMVCFNNTCVYVAYLFAPQFNTSDYITNDKASFCQFTDSEKINCYYIHDPNNLDYRIRKNQILMLYDGVSIRRVAIPFIMFGCILNMALFMYVYFLLCSPNSNSI